MGDNGKRARELDVGNSHDCLCRPTMTLACVVGWGAVERKEEKEERDEGDGDGQGRGNVGNKVS